MRPAIGIVILTLIGAASAVRAQSYHWTDASGTERRAGSLTEIPRPARPGARCTTRAVRVLGGDRLEIEGGRAVRLIGVDAPDLVGSTDPAAVAAARTELERLVKARELTLTFDADFTDEVGDLLAYAHAKDVGFVNRLMLESGRARCAIKIPNRRHASELRSAQAQARAQRRGVWQAKVPPAPRSPDRSRRGFSLGLYSREPDFDYRPFLRELVDIGASHVMLITPWFMKDHLAHRIRPRPKRSCPMAVVEQVTRQARALGLAPCLMPIVLLAEAPDDKWRGNIEPSDVDGWFSGYTEFILPFADVARASGAEMLVIGSELSSLEKHERHWRELTRNVRERFGGRLSYSANWDHLETIRFWSALDLIGMTGYHSLTQRDDPTVAQLTRRWSEIRDDVVGRIARFDMPYFFTEIGYASLDGINKNPWDYVSPERIDDQEQADCYRAWINAWSKQRGGFRGAYFYTWWRNGDSDDRRQYTVHGKPAEQVIRRYFRDR